MSKKGVFPDPDKLEAVQRFPVLTAVKPVGEIMGLAGYYGDLSLDFHK